MPNILITSVGANVKDQFYLLGQDYLKRTKLPFSPCFKQADKKRKKLVQAGSLKAKALESKQLLEASKNHYRIALDEKGKQLDSLQLATKLEKLVAQHKQVAFLIGGASGHAPELLETCGETWSLSNLTLPHRMAFCVLAEQIYRAGEILNNTPYHRV